MEPTGGRVGGKGSGRYSTMSPAPRRPAKQFHRPHRRSLVSEYPHPTGSSTKRKPTAQVSRSFLRELHICQHVENYAVVYTDTTTVTRHLGTSPPAHDPRICRRESHSRTTQSCGVDKTENINTYTEKAQEIRVGFKSAHRSASG